MLEFAKSIAKEAGTVIFPFIWNFKIILSAHDNPSQIHEKVSYADLVTESDKQVEDLIKSRILDAYPSHKYFKFPLLIYFRIIAEESATNRLVLTSEPTWIIDPIDGTSNFVSK